MIEADSLDKAVKKREHLLTSIIPRDASAIPINLECHSFQIFTRFLHTYKKKVKGRGRKSGNITRYKMHGKDEEEEHTELPPTSVFPTRASTAIIIFSGMASCCFLTAMTSSAVCFGSVKATMRLERVQQKPRNKEAAGDEGERMLSLFGA